MFVHKKIIAFLMVLLLVTGSITPAAASIQFHDVTSDHWAYSHIRRAADLGIISGYDHPETFQRVYDPDSPVTRLQAVVMVYETLQAADQLESGNDYVSRYNTMVNSAGIPWGQKQVAYALEYDIITTAELSEIMDREPAEPTQKTALREEVAVFFSRALQGEEASNDVVSMDYEDAEEISAEAIPHVGFLTEEDILRGDDIGNFNPKAGIRRSEMAAMISKSYDWLDDHNGAIIIELPPIEGIDDDEDLDDIDAEDEASIDDSLITGEIVRVNTGTRILYLIDESDDLRSFDIRADTIIEIDGNERSITNLAREEGEVAVLHFDESGRLLKIQVGEEETEFTGRINTIEDRGEYDVIIVHSTDDASDRRTFRVYDDTRIREDGRTLVREDLRTRDRVTIEAEGIRATYIEIGVQDRDTEGILDQAISFRTYPLELELRRSDDEIITYEIDDDVLVRIDGSRAELDELRRNDIVSLTLRSGLVTVIEAERIDRSSIERGTIYELTTSVNRRKLVLLDGNQEKEYTDFADRVRVYIDNEREEFGMLQPGYEVRLEIQNGQVVEIDAESRVSRDVVQGKIREALVSLNRLIVNNVISDTGRTEQVSVYVASDTVILDEDGNAIRLRDLYRDDEVIITGSYVDDIFVAHRIIVY